MLKLVQKKFCASGPYAGKMRAGSRSRAFIPFCAVTAILGDQAAALLGFGCLRLQNEHKAECCDAFHVFLLW